MKKSGAWLEPTMLPSHTAYSMWIAWHFLLSRDSECNSRGFSGSRDLTIGRFMDSETVWWDLFYKHFNPCMDNQLHVQEIVGCNYFNRATVEVWDWISNFIPHLIMDVINYPCWDNDIWRQYALLDIATACWFVTESTKAPRRSV